MSMSSTVTLVYFSPLRARAEVLRMILAYAGALYTNKTLTFEEWPKLKPTTPFGQLPLLVEEDPVLGRRVLAQTGSIARYLVQRYGLSPSDPWVAAQADAFWELGAEIHGQLNVTLNVYEGDRFLLEKKDILNKLPGYLDKISSQLGDKSFLFASVPTHTDFLWFHLLDLATALDKEVLDKFPSLPSYLDRISKVKGVSEYLASRAPLRKLPS